MRHRCGRGTRSSPFPSHLLSLISDPSSLILFSVSSVSPWCVCLPLALCVRGAGRLRSITSRSAATERRWRWPAGCWSRPRTAGCWCWGGTACSGRSRPRSKSSTPADQQPFQPYSRDELSKRLLAELPPGFRVHPTTHYLIFHDTSPAYAQWCGALFERLYMAFTNFWTRKGFELRPAGVSAGGRRLRRQAIVPEVRPAGDWAKRRSRSSATSA